MGDSMAEHQVTKLDVKTEKHHHRKTNSASTSSLKSPRTDRNLTENKGARTSPARNGRIKVSPKTTHYPETSKRPDKVGPSPTSTNTSATAKNSKEETGTSGNLTVELSPGRSRPHVTFTDGENGPDIGRIRNYQIKSVKRGVPTIDPKDETVQRITLKKRDLKIVPYWVCQRQKEGTTRDAKAWGFSTFATVICAIFPLISFSSDVAFYVTCSDHYNHTAEVLAEVRDGHNSAKTSDVTKFYEFPMTSKTKTNQSGIRTQGDATSATHSQLRPAPLKSRQKKSIRNIVSKREWRTPIQFNPYRNSLTNSQGSQQFQRYFQRIRPETSSSDSTINAQRGASREQKSIPFEKDVSSPQGTNFEVEERNGEKNDTSCDSVQNILSYMRTDKAAEELEAHRHVTIDIFEPVFILGSFPSLILCILTRLVVLVTGHKNFLSAYVINMACMPLQLITGALSVHSASYHLGKKGFECWHCALEGDCSDMGPLWWLDDGVTKTLLVSILTKILDGMAGGVVLFVVIIRLLWPEGRHATFWWNTIRAFVIFAAFVSCVTISPLLVITPAMSVLRLEFMELATPFPGRDNISRTLTVVMGLGIAAWCLSFAVLFIYVTYSMYLYCRSRTIDR